METLRLPPSPKLIHGRSNDSLNAYQTELDDVSVDMQNNCNIDDSECVRCGELFVQGLEVVQCGSKKWHRECFVCAQCLQPFPNGIYYDFAQRKYCEHDFQVLFAPCCGACGEFIIGRVIKAMSRSWHAECFRCEECGKVLSNEGFMKNAGRPFCHDCNSKEKAKKNSRYTCQRCRGVIPEDGLLKFRGENYHPYHFNCTTCGEELTEQARDVSGELYCLRCHDKMGIAICGACRRPIEERVIYALGKAWHVEHFVCAQCEKPFLGAKHYERRGLAYCDLHYQQLFGDLCERCHLITGNERVSSMNKVWCVEHFCCSTCDRQLTPEDKFFEFDLRPVCKRCYEKFPKELRKRLAKIHKADHQQPQKYPMN